MSRFTKTERQLISETNKLILSELAERVISGEKINKAEVMKEYGFTKNREGVTRVTNLISHSLKRMLEAEGYLFCCVDRLNWRWGILKSEEDYKAVVEDRAMDLKARVKGAFKIRNKALQLGFTVKELPLLTNGEQ